MIVEAPRTLAGNGEVTVTAAVAYDTPGGRPDELWFAVPASYAGHLTERSDAFATALLPLAMALGEPLELRGTISARLAYGLRDYQRLQHAWNPGLYSVVEVRPGGIAAAEERNGAAAVGAAFSGGVDSFHTLWTHLRDNQPDPGFRLTHCVMINGFDLDADLTGSGSFAALQGVYEPMMERLGVRLLVVRTNLLELVGLGVQKQSFAAFVTTPALLLGTLFGRYLVPSSYKVTQLGMYPDGSHPMFDHLLATETMETFHDRGDLTRVEKVLTIAPWIEIHRRLRVCFRHTSVDQATRTVRNCCRCEKCLRTMITLDLAGALPSFGCFPLPLRRRDVRGLEYAHYGSRLFAHENIAHAKAIGRHDIARDLRWAIAVSSHLKPAVRRLVQASYRLQQRSRLWSGVAVPVKGMLRRLGFGRGWLY